MIKDDFGNDKTAYVEWLRQGSMNQMQRQVGTFHEKLHHPINTTPQFSRPELRAGLILEESIETAVGLVGLQEALNLVYKMFDKVQAEHHAAGKQPDEPNLVEAADGMGDVLYVVFGAGVEMGIDLQPVFEEIHRTNMLKAGGPRDAMGKTQKPPGWQPPDIAKELRRQGWKG